jgi:hypothetical protein
VPKTSLNIINATQSLNLIAMLLETALVCPLHQVVPLHGFNLLAARATAKQMTSVT